MVYRVITIFWNIFTLFFENSSWLVSWNYIYSSIFVLIIGFNLGSKCAENVALHKRTLLVTDLKKANKYAAKPFFVNENMFIDEHEEYLASEITMRKKTITDSKPIHIGTGFNII